MKDQIYGIHYIKQEERNKHTAEPDIHTPPFLAEKRTVTTHPTFKATIAYVWQFPDSGVCGKNLSDGNQIACNYFKQ
jgi:hypothetical protein